MRNNEPENYRRYQKVKSVYLCILVYDDLLYDSPDIFRTSVRTEFTHPCWSRSLTHLHCVALFGIVIATWG